VPLGGTTYQQGDRVKPSFMLRALGVLAAGVLVVGSACSEDRTGDAAAVQDRDGTATGACDPQELLDCARGSTIVGLVPDEPVAADGEPIVLGMVNQENTPVGSFPELSGTVKAGVAFVNEQLGGIDGRPLELVVCNTGFSAEGSTACGQQFVTRDAPVVLGGIDVFGNAIDVLADNDIPYVGGIPISTQSMTSPNSFQWSGGTWGASVAFAAFAAEELGAERVAIIYGDFGSISQGAEYGRTALENLGVTQVQMIPYPILDSDLSAPIAAAAAGDPDTIFMLTADSGCNSAFEGVATAGLDAAVFYTGACAAPNIISASGPERTDGAYFNVEQPIDREDPDVDTALYTAVVERYSDGLDPIGAGTVSFRSFMNLYSVLRELGADGLEPAAIIEALRSKSGEPSFMGHDYSCDGRQLEGLPSVCSPQQIIARMSGGELEQVGSWIDVGAVHRAG
jgi:branched-chain amino acid transport system substrate-binding protein